MKLALLIAACSCIAVCSASQTPAKSLRTETLHDHLVALEHNLNMMASNHDQVMARMKKLEDQLDLWINAIHKLRLSIEGK